MKLTQQESKICDYLKAKNGSEVAWEELAQFAKDPTQVKLKSIKKVVSEIKRKYLSEGKAIPFAVNFKLLGKDDLIPTTTKEQELVQVKRTPGGKVILVNDTRHVAQIDFELDKQGYHRVITSSGAYQLNDNEWDMMKYFHARPGKLIPISELRDKVAYPLYGSKMPARWFDAIGRTINNLRRQVFGLDKRLLTVKSTETSYLFQ